MPGTPLRLLHAIHDFLPLSRAGSEIYAHDLCRALQARGHHVTVVCAAYDPSQPHGLVRWRAYEGLPVVEIINNWTGRTFEGTYADPLIAARLESVLDAVQPEVMHVHNLLNLTLDFPARARARGTALVATLHDYTLVCPSGGQRLHTSDEHVCRTIDPARCARCFAESPFGVRLAFSRLTSRPLSSAPLALMARTARKLMPRLVTAAASRAPQPPVTAQDIDVRLRAARAVFDQVDLFVAPAEATAAEYIDLGVAPGRIRVSDYGFRRRATRGRRERSDRLRIGFVGTLVHHKGVHVLLEALRLLQSPRAQCTIVGDTAVFPDYTARLRDLAAGLDVQFVGGFSGDDLDAVYQQIDVLVVPSIWLENSPLVIHEAQMAGVPVVGSRIGGIPGLVEHDVNGLLFDADSPASLATALGRLLEEPDLLSRLSDAAPPAKTIDDDAREWEEAYSSVLASRARALQA